MSTGVPVGVGSALGQRCYGLVDLTLPVVAVIRFPWFRGVLVSERHERMVAVHLSGLRKL